MDYEKLYKESLKAVKELIQINPSDEGIQNWADVHFPELKESEDEKIRKELLEHCKNQAKPYIRTGNKCPQIQSWIAWLEKQGEQEEPQVYETENGEVITYSETDGYKVEPKFKVGDWVVNNVCLPIQIASIEDGMYIFTEGDALSISFIDENYHLWTIEDAKDGDVIVKGDWVFIYKGLFEEFNGNDNVMYHCRCDYLTGSAFEVSSSNKIIGNINEHYRPALECEIELLFKRINENGYVWDEDLMKVVKLCKPNNGEIDMDEMCKAYAIELGDDFTNSKVIAYKRGIVDTLKKLNISNN